jgi:hypothetical protein
MCGVFVISSSSSSRSSSSGGGGSLTAVLIRLAPLSLNTNIRTCTSTSGSIVTAAVVSIFLLSS